MVSLDGGRSALTLSQRKLSVPVPLFVPRLTSGSKHNRLVGHRQPEYQMHPHKKRTPVLGTQNTDTLWLKIEQKFTLTQDTPLILKLFLGTKGASCTRVITVLSLLIFHVSEHYLRDCFFHLLQLSSFQALVQIGDQKMLVPKKAATMPKPQWHPPWKLYRVGDSHSMLTQTLTLTTVARTVETTGYEIHNVNPNPNRSGTRPGNYRVGDSHSMLTQTLTTVAPALEALPGTRFTRNG